MASGGIGTLTDTPPQNSDDSQPGNSYPPARPPAQQPGNSYPPAPPPAQQPGNYPAGTTTAQGEIPGKTLGIVGLILSFFTALIGMIVSIIALRQSKRAGYKNTPAVIGIIIGALATLAGIIAIIVAIIAVSSLAAKCADLGPGVHRVNGVTYTCS